MREYFVYIMTNQSGTLYIGVTNNLEKRVLEHKNELIDGFTKKYNCKKLIYFEQTSDVESAISREKQLKKWRREKKVKLINKLNPSWEDLSRSLGFDRDDMEWG
ncbi:MAG: GIY-YIG nuclease family protein [Patescibacteria group bacterium]|jgi:putative endonuclease|nr:GIY-YIG nuclease family protein [Patescibacteria group bacterium]